MHLGHNKVQIQSWTNLLELISLDHYIIRCAALIVLSIMLENIIEVEYSACVIIKIVCLFTKSKHSSLELVLFVW
jgi:hypothetical protein